MTTLTQIAQFQDNYEVKNGEIASADVLNKAVHKSHLELISLWNFVRNDNSGIDDTINLFDDTIGNNTSDYQVRSIQGLHNEVFNGGTWS